MCHTFFERTNGHMRKFVAVAQKKATRGREVRCLPHEFHAMQAPVCARLNVLMMEQFINNCL